ncbi:hypothetical protein [Actinacidiphila soli]|uniref:hypothetical protein n=1 Tax=Actinacidiphila soli TaxID=2487275 RepID=UPI000FCCBE6D|nr:hypothetical protein [Actinacidiphila soli]
MRTALRCTPVLVLSAVLLTGCNIPVSGSDAKPSGTAAPAPSGSAHALPVGAGPQTHYTVQAQPAAGSCHYRYDHKEPLPDPVCTPGAVSPAVTQANLSTTICRKGGYTSGIRPSAYITGKEKAANAKSYGYTGSFRDAEYDHLLSLQLGGDPNDYRNLWVEAPDPGHRTGAGPNNNKDKVENRLHTAVCNHQVTLTAAQQAIATDWTTAETVLGISPQ